MSNAWQEKAERVSPLESVASHAILVLAVAFALYPVLWVVSLAFSGDRPLVPEVLPIPHHPTLRHLTAVVTTRHGGDWLFGRQLANSIIVSLATAAVGVVIAIPTAYALARFRFAGKERGLAALLATQMFPTVARAIPLYLMLNALHLLNSRTGGGSWTNHRVTRAQVLTRMEPVRHGTPELWPVVLAIVDDASARGWLIS